MRTATEDPPQSASRPWGGQSPQRGDTTARRLVEVLATAAGEDTTASVTGALVGPVVRARGRHASDARRCNLGYRNHKCEAHLDGII